jgi:hypothetical protein
MTSDQGDFIGMGKAWGHYPSDSIFFAGGNGETVGADVYSEARSWSLKFEAPDDEALTQGTTYRNATRFPSQTHAGMNITGGASACNTLTGEFTVNEIHLNEYDELERFSASFEQHCEGGTPALRGTFEFRALSADLDPDPETDIISGPSGIVTSRDASFSFAGSANSTFECSLDNSGFQPCTSPRFYQDLSEGPHTFQVRARSPRGRPDSSPAQRAWIVDAVGPVISVVRPTAGVYVNDQAVGQTGPIIIVGSVTVQATATDAESGVPTVGFDVDGTPVDPSNITRQGDSFQFTFRPPSAGQHTITVRATNGSGLPSTAAVSVYGVGAG